MNIQNAAFHFNPLSSYIYEGLTWYLKANSNLYLLNTTQTRDFYQKSCLPQHLMTKQLLSPKKIPRHCSTQMQSSVLIQGLVETMMRKPEDSSSPTGKQACFAVQTIETRTQNTSTIHCLPTCPFASTRPMMRSMIWCTNT